MDYIPITYRASEELVSFIEELGFQEITRKEFPDHYKRIQTNGYSPNSVKRVFKRGYVHIRLDYIHLFIEYKSRSINNIIWEGYKIEENDLVSYVSFPKTFLKYKLIH